MPKYTKKREQIEAKKLSKSFLTRGTGAAIAKDRGTSRQNENEKLRRLPVQKTLQDIISKNLEQAGITQTKVYKRLNEELDATRQISKDIEVPDNHSRDRAIDKCLTLYGHIKTKGEEGKGVTVINVIYGHRSNQ